MKRSISDLAIFGGPIAFSETLHVGRPNIGDRDLLFDRVKDAFNRRWLTNGGPYVEQFELEVARLLGVNHCVAMCNATVALQVAARAAGLHGEVIVPAFTFIATAHALQWQNIKPVFCDIDERTHNIDVDALLPLITPRTTGIVGVHLWGRACDVNTLNEIARSRNLKLIFDSAHAFGCTYKGRTIGNFGNAEVLSFHATKVFNTFEGGALVTNDEELAARARLMCNYGFAGFDDVACVGTNGKMNEIAAAMGLTSLEQLEYFITVNFRNYRRYALELGDLKGVHLLPYSEVDRANYQYIVLEIDNGPGQVSRDQLMDILWKENIRARRYFYPGCHRMEPYHSQALASGEKVDLPHTDHVASRVLCLPTGTAVSLEDISKICNIIQVVMTHSGEVHRRLSSAV